MAQQSSIELQNLVGTRQSLVPQAPQYKDGRGQAQQQRLLEKVQEQNRDQGQAQQQREGQVQEQNRGSISGPSSEASYIGKERRVRGKYKCYQVDMKTKGGKLKIAIPDDILRPVKDNARDIVNFCGFIVRSLAPLDVDTWQEVVAVVGTQMMKQVKEKFMADPHNEFRFDAFLLSTMQRLYRCWKNRLHMIYKKYNNDEERMKNIPDDVTPEAWKKLMDHFSSLEFQKVSQRNSKNRSKLTTKHTCGTRSYAEVEEMTRDPITGEKAPPDEVWLKQHTKMTDVGEVRWSDPKSKEIHEQLHQFVIEQTNVDEGEQMTRDEILLHVLGEKSGYFRGKGAGKKVPTKRGRQMEDVNEQVQRAIDRAKKDMMGQFTESMLEKVREEVRSEVRAEVRAEIQEELKTEIRAQLQLYFVTMFQERIAAFLGSISQSRS